MTRSKDPVVVRITIKDIYDRQEEHTRELSKLREVMETAHATITGKVALSRNIATGAAGMSIAVAGWLVSHLLSGG